MNSLHPRSLNHCPLFSDVLAPPMDSSLNNNEFLYSIKTIVPFKMQPEPVIGMVLYFMRLLHFL